MKILLTGGGTMGSVTPLLAVADALRAHGHELVFVGTKSGPERAVVEAADIRFLSIPAAKLPRYISTQWITMPFVIGIAKLRAVMLLRAEQPDVIVSAGAYVSVPLAWVGKIWFGIPVVIHQQDVVPGLANKLMAFCANTVTTTFEESLHHFKATLKRKVKWIGNPVRDLAPATNTITPLLDTQLPTVLIMGGGTGAAGINALVSERLCAEANVIHLTGKGKGDAGSMQTITSPHYHSFEFLNEELPEALHAATVVVSRAGLGSITELAALQKPTIFIPMPNSHQEQNADIIKNANAGTVVGQAELTPEKLADAVEDIVKDPVRQKLMSRGMDALFPEGANNAFIHMIEQAGNIHQAAKKQGIEKSNKE